MYDIVFISYNEPNADSNYARLKSRFPFATRIHGVKGIHQAHIEAAKKAKTNMLWIVDGDAVIDDDFDFKCKIDYRDEYSYKSVRVWRSRNPINGLVYGYGGVKLFPRKMTIEMDTSSKDMTTSISPYFRAMETISNTTAFNTDPFNTWKSAFRECCKLASRVIARQNNIETIERLNIWKTVGKDKTFGEYAVLGAQQGHAYGIANKMDGEALSKINDFDWLKEQFDDTQQ